MKISIKFGIIFGFLVPAWTMAVHMLGFYTYNIQHAELVDKIALVLPISIMLIALIRENKIYANKLKLKTGVTTGAIIGIVSAPISYAGVWIYHHYINPDWLNIILEYKTSQMNARGISILEINQTINRLKSTSTDLNLLISTVIGTVILCLILSCVISILIILYNKYYNKLNK